MTERYSVWKFAPIAVLLVLLPFLVEDFRVFQINLTLVYAIAILGLNLLTGYGGQISLGHGAFYAIGAYIAAMLIEHAGFSFYLTPVFAGMVCLLLGFLMGFPALRLTGHYLALATFALAVAVPQLLKFKPLEHLTGGVQGIVLIRPTPWFGFEFLGKTFNDDRSLYYFILLLTLLMFWLCSNLLSGRVGRAIVAVRDHPVAASALGVNLTQLKTITFGVSAAITGVAGALGAMVVAFVAPDSFTSFFSISLLVGAVVGGLGSMWGPFFGAMFIQFVPNLADQVSKSAPWAVYGALLLALVYVAPKGVAGVIAQFINSRRSK